MMFRKKVNIQELLDNPIGNWKEEHKSSGYSVYYRTIPESELLKKSDYKRGFGLNSDHYMKVRKYRKENNLPTSESFTQSYDHKDRDGRYRIDGTLIESKYHPLHDKMLLNTKTGDKYHIDVVNIHYHYGMILVLSTRKEGTKSHGTIFWEAIKGGDSDTLKDIEKNHKLYKLIEK